MVTVGIWNRQGTMDEEFSLWDNQTFYTKMGPGLIFPPATRIMPTPREPPPVRKKDVNAQRAVGSLLSRRPR